MDTMILKLSPDDTRETIFGSLDGLTSCLGVIAGLVAAGTHSGPKILAGSIGLAVAATAGMGAGQYLSQLPRNLHLALIMAAATLIGSIAPAIPFLFGYGTAQVIASGCVVVIGGLAIGRIRGYKLTFALLISVCVVTVGLSVVVA